MRAFHENIAARHRATESRHRAALEIHTAHALRLQDWRVHRPDDTPPAFMAAVAEIIGSGSALIALLDSRQAEALVVSSDHVAQAAHDLESTFGEGPTRDAATGRCPVAVRGTAIDDRWPLYGPAMRRLGIRSVDTAPLRTESHCFGALTVFHTGPLPPHAPVPPLTDLADALTSSVLLADELPLLAETDHQAVVHQATGWLSAQHECSIADARALIEAHAFAEGEPIDAVAATVLSGRLHFES